MNTLRNRVFGLVAPLNKIAALAITLMLITVSLPTWQSGRGDVTFNAGPYTLNMHFDELPKPWWSGDWWDTNWGYRQKLTFDAQNLSTDLQTMPVLVLLNSTRINYSDLQDLGQDIRFVSDDGFSVLNHEIEEWDKNGTSVIWVKIDQIDAGSTDDYIWMYYGNPSANDNQRPDRVWTDRYVGVWHLSEDPSGPAPQMQDSTSYMHEGSTWGSMVANDSVDAMFSNGLRLDGVDDLLHIAHNATLDGTSDFGTLELWLKWTNSSDGDYQIVMTSSNRFTPGLEDGYEWASEEDGDHFFSPWSGDVNNYNIAPDPFTDGVWHHLLVTLDYAAKEVHVFVDNNPIFAVQGNVTVNWTSMASPDDWLWGGNPDRPTRYFDGVFDEIRVSDIVRSADWRLAQYMSMTDSLIGFSPMETKYSYRQQLTVTASSSDIPAGYSVFTTFDHESLVLAGKSQADGDDIRIVYWNSSDWIELDRVIAPDSSWNAASTVIWFHVHEQIQAGTSDDRYYMYYGSASAMNPPTSATPATRIRSVQSGTATSLFAGPTIIPISQVDMSKSFLIFTARHDSGRPVGSMISGRISTPFTVSFNRVTDEMTPVPINIEWYVVEYSSGVSVQRGMVLSQSSPVLNEAISPVGDVNQTFVTWSKTPGFSDVNWSSDDPTIGELTSSNNLQFRVFAAHSGHAIWWQVIEYTYPGSVFVQRGSGLSMLSAATIANASLSTPVDTNKTFALVSFNTEGSGPDVGARLLRAQLVNSTNIIIDRSISGNQDNITDISWQAVELRDGSRVFSGSEHFPQGVGQRNVVLPSPVDTTRSVAFASVQPATGQSMGRSPLNGNDAIGVGSASMALSSTEITMRRDNTSDEADIGWFVVEFKQDLASVVHGPEESTASLQMTASVHHVMPDGSDPQLIVSSSTVTISNQTPNPLSISLGNGSQISFSDSNPRLLRLEIDITSGSPSERFVFAYDSVIQPSNLSTPANISTTFYLHDAGLAGPMPAGRQMSPFLGAAGSSMIFNTTGQRAYWYSVLWSPPSITILSPTTNEHITGVHEIQYSINPSVTNVSFEYHDGMSWVPIGYDSDLDGVYPWDVCSPGDSNVTLRGTGLDALSNPVQDVVTNIEIDCTPPAIQILNPLNNSVVDENVTITYAVDADAVKVELLYNDGMDTNISTETPPDGTATWTVDPPMFSGASLYAYAWDEVGLSSFTEVINLSTPLRPSVSILSPVDSEHVTGAYPVQYSIADTATLEFFYWNGSWVSLGLDADLDGTFPWNTCALGEMTTSLRAVAENAYNDTAEDIVANIEIDCTAPTIQILSPLDDSVVDGDVTIAYNVDADAVTVELVYNDGADHNISTEMPPDGTALWNVDALTLSGASLYAYVWDEMGFSSFDVVTNLSTPLLPSISIASPTDDEHLTGTYSIQYSISEAVTAEFFYWDTSWVPIGLDGDLDGIFPWNVCAVGDMLTSLRGVATNAFNDTAEDVISNIEIDCTAPAIQILSPLSDSTIDGNVMITYNVDADAVRVELFYNDGTDHNVSTEMPPDGTATWDVGLLSLAGASLFAYAWDEVGLFSMVEVVNLSTPVAPTVAITSPTDFEHVTGVYSVQYALTGAVSVEFLYWDSLAWASLGFDTDLDGTFPWDVCAIGDSVTRLSAIALNAYSDSAMDIVTDIEIDCTPPVIQILDPPDNSEIEGDVSINYTVDPDAVLVELRYNDGQLHTISTEFPPDGTAIWNVDGMNLSGVSLIAIAWDEVGLSSQDEVVGLYTPEEPIQGNEPPTISGVPDIIVHYDYSYNFDLTSYIEDIDNTTDELTVWTSDSAHIWINVMNNLGLVMNYPQSMLNMTVPVTIWVTDGIGTDFQVINVTISEDYPPEKLRPLPDVSFFEDQVSINVLFTNLDYYFLDVDGDNLYYTSGNKSVSVRINADKTVDMWAEENWNGFEIITIRATDPTGALVEDILIVQVIPVNDAPTIDDIPDVHVWVDGSYTMDIQSMLEDVDDPLSALTISTDSQYVQVDGFNLTFRYSKGMEGEYVWVSVSDGNASSGRLVRVIVHDDSSSWFPIWILIILILIVVLIWGINLAFRRKIHGALLFSKDGSLLQEFSFTDKAEELHDEVIELAGVDIQKLDTFVRDRFAATPIHGNHLHLVVISFGRLPENAIEKLTMLVEEFDVQDTSPSEEYLTENLSDFKNGLAKIRESS